VRVWGVLAGALLVAATPYAARQAGRLPDPEPLYAAARANLERAQAEQRAFAYRERRTELHLNPFGRMGSGGTVVYDVTPTPDGGTERRLIERDGKPLANPEVEKRPPRARRSSRRSIIEDAVAVLRFSVDRREVIGGQPAIAVRFEPTPGAEAQTREGNLARRFAGTIFVDETTKEVVRVHAMAIDDLTYGFGMVARLGKGTSITLTRERVEPNLWLPTSVRFTGTGRALLFRRLDIDQSIEWTNYRRVR
jgi:hypothetical protein